MEYRFTYFDNTTEIDLTQIDFSGLTFGINDEATELIYIEKLNGSIKIFGSDFDVFYNLFLSGEIAVLGNFKVNDSDYFNKIYYQLDAKSFDIESKVVECEIVAEDDYYLLKRDYNKKFNVYKFDLARVSLTVYKQRTKLWFYETEVTGSSLWLNDSVIGNIYAREEIKEATENEINSLVGINGWMIEGTSIVRDWSFSGDFATPTSAVMTTRIILHGEDYDINDQYPSVAYFLSDYTLLHFEQRPDLKYDVRSIINADYYGVENDFKYETVDNAIGLKSVIDDITKEIDSSISSFVTFNYESLFDFASGEAIVLQALSEIATAKTRSQTITGNQIEPATIGYLTLEKINRFLREYWNIYFYRSGNSILYKHYSELFGYATENDLTVSRLGNLTPVQEISFNSNDRFNRIERSLTADNIDFVGVDAEFENVKNDKIKTVSNQNFFTDIDDIIGNTTSKYSENSVDSWVFAHRASNSVVVEGTQILSSRFDSFTNEKMSLAYSDANLLVGSDKTATINGSSKTLTDSFLFDYATLLEFQIPSNLVFSLNKRAFFKTDYSDTHRLKSLKLKLDGSAADISLYY